MSTTDKNRKKPNYLIEEISLSDLEINTENPRFDIAGGQREAIRVMLADQGPKILNLARDIVDFGLNPSELTIVSPLNDPKGMYVVLEGNRRVSALKLLNNPDLASVHNSPAVAKFKKLAKDYTEIKKISCVVFLDLEDAHRWIKLKHTGENDGVGTVRWDAQQVARFDERTGGGSAIALQVIDFLTKSKEIDDDLKSNLHKIPLTNLDRLITDKNIQDLLGITIQENKLITAIKEVEVVRGLKKIVGDLISKKIKVKDIYNKKDRARYIETFKNSEIPKKTEKAAEPWELVSPKNFPSTQRPSRRSTPPSTARKHLIPSDCIFSIKAHTRINKVYFELKFLDCDEFPNAAAVLMRVFVELSADAYLDIHKIGKLNEDSKLHNKISGIADNFEAKSILSKGELKGIRTVTSNPNHILSTNTFNAYVHNKNFHPISNDLKTTWDNIQSFIKKVWENI